MSDVTVMYNIEGYWVEINIDCLESIINPMVLTIESNNRMKGEYND